MDGLAFATQFIPAAPLVHAPARFFYRCVDCLAVGAADEYVRDASCIGCGGRIESMGRVGKSGRLVTESIECPCDARCTNAKGPKCDCKCNGANHGSGMLVVVVRDAGPLPVLLMPISLASRKRATEWREALTAARAEVDRLKAGEAARGGSWRRYYAARSAIHKARGRRSHVTRMADLSEFAGTAPAAPVQSQTMLFG